jgi:signal transduction histidine kinase
MIKTIIRNLVSNSIKFSLADTNVTINALDSDSMKIIIVEDHGIGWTKVLSPIYLKLMSILHATEPTKRKAQVGIIM